MRLFVTIIFTILFAVSVEAQNGSYTSTHQEYKTENGVDDKEQHQQCNITIEIYGVGGKDYVSVEFVGENNKILKWHITDELQMQPDATGKSVFKSYNATLSNKDGKLEEYQISIIKGANSGKLKLAAINNEGSTWWFYNLQKVTK